MTIEIIGFFNRVGRRVGAVMDPKLNGSPDPFMRPDGTGVVVVQRPLAARWAVLEDHIHLARHTDVRDTQAAKPWFA